MENEAKSFINPIKREVKILQPRRKIIFLPNCFILLCLERSLLWLLFCKLVVVF